MADTAVTPSPGFISIAVTDVARSAAFYERYLGGIRDTFDFGPGSAVFMSGAFITGWTRTLLGNFYLSTLTFCLLPSTFYLLPFF